MSVKESQAAFAKLAGPAWAACAGLKSREDRILTELETLQSENPHLARPEDDAVAVVWGLKLADASAKVEALLAKGSRDNPVAVTRLRDEERSVDFWTSRLAARRRQLQELDAELEGS